MESPPAADRRFYHSTIDFLRDLPSPAKRFWVLVVVTGALAGASAALLLHGLRFLQHLAWGTTGGFLNAVESASWVRRLVVPGIAGVVVGVVALVVRRPLRGHGTAGLLESIWTKSGRMPFWWSIGRSLVSIVAVALGAPLGREGALLQTGAATSSALGARLRVPPDRARLLVACGASAGIAAAYNAPIGAALFGLEVLLGSFALELFGPIVVSCVVATLVSRNLITEHPVYVIPHYKLLAFRELALAVPFGAMLGVASAVYVRMIEAFSVVLEGADRRLGYATLPVVAMLTVGAASAWFPQLLGNGTDTVNAALLGQVSVALLLTLPVLKMISTSLCAGAGIPGGLFTPSLFYGALIGAAGGLLIQYVWPGSAPSGAYALLGMGAVLAGTTHAAVSAVLLIFELTGNYEVILPLMLTAVVSAAVSRRLEPESLYTAVLRRRGIELPGRSSPSWLRSTRVGEFVEPGVETIRPDASITEAVAMLIEMRPGTDLYVVDPNGRLQGAVVLDAIRGHLPDITLLSRTKVSQFSSPVRGVRTDASLSEVAAMFGEMPYERLPVVDLRGKLVGTISKSRLLQQGQF